MQMQKMGVDGGESGGNGLPVWKRALDWALIVLLSPLLLCLAGLVVLIIKWGSYGPILFRQNRVGYKGSQFRMFKFRTMLLNADEGSHRRHTQNLIRSNNPMIKLDAGNDPRLIPLGNLLRATGLDELPQVLNVLRGEMSLVGPRPCIPYECDNYEPWHWRRFDATPGLTGLWQVSGKNRTTFDQMVRLDIEYCERKSFWLDVRIILKTVPALREQYCDLRARRRRQPVAPARALRKSLQSSVL
jgi:lipopolysaccharide/colanic/teichoic acid biosynthesis glycosyltransferase